MNEKPTIVSESIRATVSRSRVFAVDSNGQAEVVQRSVDPFDIGAAGALSIFADELEIFLARGVEFAVDDVIGMLRELSEKVSREGL